VDIKIPSHFVPADVVASRLNAAKPDILRTSRIPSHFVPVDVVASRLDVARHVGTLFGQDKLLVGLAVEKITDSHSSPVAIVVMVDQWEVLKQVSACLSRLPLA
jgi:hypothetical protein